MNVTDKYLEHLDDIHFFEEMKVITEDISQFFTGSKLELIKNKMVDAAKKKDSAQLQRIASIVPKVPEDTLYKIGLKANPDFRQTYNHVDKKVKSKLGIIDIKLRSVLSTVVSSAACLSDNPKEKSDKLIDTLSKAVKKKSMVPATGMIFGIFIIAGILVGVSYATISMSPLLVGIIIVGLAILLIPGG